MIRKRHIGRPGDNRPLRVQEDGTPGPGRTGRRASRRPSHAAAPVLKHQLDEWKDDDDAQEVVPVASIDVDQDDDGASQSPTVDAAEAAVGDEMEAGGTSMSVEDADDSPMGQVQPRLRIRTVTTSRRRAVCIGRKDLSGCGSLTRLTLALGRATRESV